MRLAAPPGRARRADPVRPEGPGYTVAPVFAARVAGVPMQALEQLRFTRTWELVDELAETSAWLAREGAALSDLLHEVIGGAAGTPLKPRLVGLRRAVFTGRRPDRQGIEAIGALPRGLAGRIRAWLGRRDRLAGLRAELPGVLAAETEEKTALLREAAGARPLRHGLAQASPVLSARVDEWVTGRSHRPPERSELLALARYLARATVKTSPYTTFTLSGLGEWAAEGPAMQPPSDLAWRGVGELDRGMLRLVWSALTRRPEVRARAGIRVNPAAADDGDRIWFLGSGPGEPLSSVPSSQAVRDVLAWVHAHPRPLAGDRPGVEPLLAAGLLELVPPYDEQGDDPVGQLAAWLAHVPELASISDAVQRIRAASCTGPTGDAVELRHRDATVRLALDDLVGSGVPDRNSHIETAVLPGGAGRCGVPGWQAACRDLNAVRQILGLLDPDLPAKVAAVACFLDRYGPAATVPALDFYRHVHSDRDRETTARLRAMLRDPMAATQTIPGVARLDALAATRRRFWELIHAQPAVDGVLRVDPARVAALAAEAPPFVRPPGSVCCYVQPIPDPDGLRLALGLITAGYGRGLSRLHRLVELAGGDVPPIAHLSAPWQGADTLEFRGLAGGGMDLRAPVADRTLDYPSMAAGTGPGALALTDLLVGYDGGKDRLVLRDRGGRLLLPLHLGMTAQYWTRPGMQFLVRVFGEPAAAMAPSWAFRSGGGLPAPGAVEHRSRVEIGRVVFARACARLRAGDFPAPAKGEEDAVYLPRLAGWLSEHGIARRFFARVVDLSGGLGPVLLSKAHKPIHVDVTDHFSLTGFLRSIRDPEALMLLEEALPDPSEAPSYGAEGRRVTEYVVQLSATEPGR